MPLSCAASTPAQQAYRTDTTPPARPTAALHAQGFYDVSLSGIAGAAVANSNLSLSICLTALFLTLQLVEAIGGGAAAVPELKYIS
jgi:hypothetical protein